MMVLENLSDYAMAKKSLFHSVYNLQYFDTTTCLNFWKIMFMFQVYVYVWDSQSA